MLADGLVWVDSKQVGCLLNPSSPYSLNQFSVLRVRPGDWKPQSFGALAHTCTPLLGSLKPFPQAQGQSQNTRALSVVSHLEEVVACLAHRSLPEPSNAASEGTCISGGICKPDICIRNWNQIKVLDYQHPFRRQ